MSIPKRTARNQEQQGGGEHHSGQSSEADPERAVGIHRYSNIHIGEQKSANYADGGVRDENRLAAQYYQIIEARRDADDREHCYPPSESSFAFLCYST